MDVYGLISLVGLLVMGLLSVRPTIRTWRNLPTRVDNYRPTSPLGKAVFHGVRRSMPVAVGLGIPLLVAALVLILLGGATTSGGKVARGAFVVVAFLYVLLLIPLYLFNRPRAVVPPHLRDEAGMMKEMMHGGAWHG